MPKGQLLNSIMEAKGRQNSRSPKYLLDAESWGSAGRCGAQGNLCIFISASLKETLEIGLCGENHF